MTVAYDGTDFAGFQFQAGKVRTVQGELEKAASRVMMPASRCVGASRTDGGAHALGQVVHMDAQGSLDSFEPDTLQLYINGVLPDDVKVQRIEMAPPGFDSHFSSCGKEYHYLLGCGAPEPRTARQRWWVYDRWCEQSRGKPRRLDDIRLDVAAMQEAAELLQGIHDYSAFMDKKRPSGLGRVKRKKPHLVERGIKPERTPDKNVRHLWKVKVVQEDAAPWPPRQSDQQQQQQQAGGQGRKEQEQEQQEQEQRLEGDEQQEQAWQQEGGRAAGGPGCADSGLVRIEVAGNGFLYRMVRMMVTALVEVGHGRMTPARLKQVLESGDRAALSEAAPPQGLYLMRVLYELPEGVQPPPAGRRKGGGGGGGVQEEDGGRDVDTDGDDEGGEE